MSDKSRFIPARTAKTKIHWRNKLIFIIWSFFLFLRIIPAHKLSHLSAAFFAPASFPSPCQVPSFSSLAFSFSNLSTFCSFPLFSWIEEDKIVLPSSLPNALKTPQTSYLDFSHFKLPSFWRLKLILFFLYFSDSDNLQMMVRSLRSPLRTS